MLSRLQSGNVEKIEPYQVTLMLEKGILVDTRADELGGLKEKILARKQRQHWIDVTFLAAPTNRETSSERDALAKVTRYIREVCESNAAALIKLRFCGSHARPLADRRECFDMLLTSLRSIPNPLVSMWMSDDLLEVLKVDPVAAHSFFFMYDLTRSVLPNILIIRMFAYLKKLVDAQKAVMLQVALNHFEDIKRHRKSLALMASLSSKIDARYLNWGLRVKESEFDLYYAPEVCSSLGQETETERIRSKKALAAIGLPFVHPLRLYQFQHDCPGLQKNSRTFDWRGNVFTCLQNRPDSQRDRQNRQRSAGLAMPEEKMTVPACRRCAFLPMCMAACSKNSKRHSCDELTAIYKAQLAGAVL